MSKSNLIKHAEYELSLIDEEPEFVAGYLTMIQIFADMNHSGVSASVFIAVLRALLRFENLTPITNAPDEWNGILESDEDSLWQSRRNPAYFSRDGGKTYYHVDHKNQIFFAKEVDALEYFPKEARPSEDK
jgi:hypothetical protein